jgi:lysophospholipase L1-like esterase
MASASPTLEPGPLRRDDRRRVWLFRLLAVLIGLLPLAAFEGMCAVFDWGRPSLHDDPFVGFRAVRPLFVRGDDGTRYEIPQSRYGFFRPESFAAVKPRGEFRAFCLGESTVQGNPWGIETSFTTWLEIALGAADNSRQWEVVNCGGVSYASYRLTPILQEVLDYQPDLVILCVGHNEFLESRTFESVKDRGPALNAALGAASQLRTFTLLREGYLRLQGKPAVPQSRPILPTEVEALLDYRGGLETYHRDEAWHRGVIAQYEYNLRRMIGLCRAARVPLILIDPVCNLADSPPFKSEHDRHLPAERLAEWEATCKAARKHLRGEDRDLAKATARFEEACRIDPLHAAAFYNLGKCYEAAGNWPAARAAYIAAKELDVCPLRILEPMHEIVQRIARETDTPLLNAQQLFAERSTGGVVGGEWLVDHVHPKIEGHQLLADQLLARMASLDMVQPRGDWQAQKQARFEEHFQSLDNLYFMRGVQHLESLRGWAAGRARKLRPANNSATGPASQISTPADHAH